MAVEGDIVISGKDYGEAYWILKELFEASIIQEWLLLSLECIVDSLLLKELNIILFEP